MVFCATDALNGLILNGFSLTRMLERDYPINVWVNPSLIGLSIVVLNFVPVPTEIKAVSISFSTVLASYLGTDLIAEQRGSSLNNISASLGAQLVGAIVLTVAGSADRIYYTTAIITSSLAKQHLGFAIQKSGTNIFSGARRAATPLCWAIFGNSVLSITAGLITAGINNEPFLAALKTTAATSFVATGYFALTVVAGYGISLAAKKISSLDLRSCVRVVAQTVTSWAQRIWGN